MQVGRARLAHAHPCTDLLGLLQAAHAQDGYEPVLREALRLDPGDPRLLRAWAELLHDLGRNEAALAAATAWLALCPGGPHAVPALAAPPTGVAPPAEIAPPSPASPLAAPTPPRQTAPPAAAPAPAPAPAGEQNARALLAAILVELDRGDEALAIARALVAQSPGTARHWSNLGATLRRLGRTAEARPAFARAVALAPAEPQIRLNHATALLQAGRLAEGWRDYEARLALPGHTRLPAGRLLPDLASLHPDALRGRTILCTHEEGFGDTLQFARYLPMLAARGARVVALVPKPLLRLLRTLSVPGPVHAPGPAADPGLAIEVAEQNAAPPPPYDWHCPMLSLPRAFRTTLGTIPCPGPYLHPPAATRPAATRPAAPRSAAPGSSLRIGLAWAGQSRPWQPGIAAIDRRRSLPLAALAPLAAIPGIELVALQKGPAAAEARTAPFALEDAVAAARDFADTAAVVAGLDAVVCVDSAVAHLAGALGRPVLLLDRFDPCWRWLDGRDDSPWYPRLRILRQDRPGEWAAPVARAAALLASWDQAMPGSASARTPMDQASHRNPARATPGPAKRQCPPEAVSHEPRLTSVTGAGRP